jgi:FAD/FMN-containing dehydrogenase
MLYTKTPVQIAKHKSAVRLKRQPQKLAYPLKHKVTRLELAAFELSIHGKVVYPWSKGYNSTRRDFNNVYPAYPLLIAFPVSIHDLRTCLRFSHENNLWTVVRSGGHSLAGFSVCDGMVIDMSSFKSVFINLSDNTAIIDSGCTFGEIYPKVESYNLHLPGGGCPTVSVAGFMQGGGYSFTSRNFGMNCDCVQEITVMLQDGNIVVANRNKNADLFWAMRGGTGNNFGILLTIKYQLFPLKHIMGVQLTWNIDDNLDNAALALLTIQDTYLKDYSHPQLGIETVLTTDAKDNKKKVYFCGAWLGEPGKLDEVLSPLWNIPGVEKTISETGSFSKINNDLLEYCPVLPEGIKAYSQSTYIAKSLSVNDWKDILTFFRTAPNKYTMVDMEGYGGAIGKVPESDCAFIHRNVLMDFFCDAFFNEETNDQKKNEEWLQSFMLFMGKYSNGHSYQNYPNRLQQDFKWSYWGKYYDQLVAIKRKYDPQNFFHYMQSIGEPISPEYKNLQLNIIETNTPIIYEAY